MENDSGQGLMEASLIGSGFGAVLGGFTLGAGADIMNVAINPLLPYAVGALAGAMAGFVAGRIAASRLF